ncbi:unnamed protein product [Lactuca saligna]|uniref:EF-hand domain-containing protein n=1 Tax=Lactuca saligna TaxID=75948 RepID=A0AA36E7N0_LACSI|nr:unnamed protein product [Lactuca saligna]
MSLTRSNRTLYNGRSVKDGQSTNFSIFNLLDVDKNGTLDFYEMMTAFYIIMSERPFCDSCEKFITSSYFTCVGCLENQIESSFDLCLDCYYMKKLVHTHNGSDRFLDNHSLLAITKSIIKEANSSTAMKTNSVVKDAGGRHLDDPKKLKRQNTKDAFEALTKGINAGIGIANFAATVGMCSIV